MGNFAFARATWPSTAEEAQRAGHYTYGDPRSSIFYARRTNKTLVAWLHRADSTLEAPYKDDLVSLLYEPTFKQLVGPSIMAKMDLIRKQGNFAVHRAAPLRDTDSVPVVRELFHVVSWLAIHYAPTTEGRPVAGAVFDATMHSLTALRQVVVLSPSARQTATSVEPRCGRPRPAAVWELLPRRSMFWTLRR